LNVTVGNQQNSKTLNIRPFTIFTNESTFTQHLLLCDDEFVELAYMHVGSAENNTNKHFTEQK